MIFSWEPLEFDTKIFGITIAKINLQSDAATELEFHNGCERLVQELKAKDITYASIRFPAGLFSLTHALEKTGFIMIDAMLSMRLKDFHLVPANKNIRPANRQDLFDLKKLAGNVFQYTRFYNDPILRPRANMLYEAWVQNSLNGKVADQTLVWEDNDELLGFLTMQKSGHIPLVAIAKKAQGTGISRELISQSYALFTNWGVDSIEIETQLTNIPAIRSYQSRGFKIFDSFLTYRWSSS